MTKTWATEHAIWAAISPLSGRELTESQQVVSDATHEVRTRYIPGITPGKRILHGIRELYIENVRNLDERNREVVMICVERG